MGFLFDLFSMNYYVYWVESLVILAVILFILYVSYSLNLFKKG
jgi:hypothetical protein